MASQSPLISYIQQNYNHLTEEKPPLEIGKSYSFSDFEDPIYDKYLELIDQEFPLAPFNISLEPDVLLQLDQPFTDRKKIKLIDTNIRTTNYYYMNLPNDKIDKMKKSIYVHQINNQPITLRQVLDTMIHHRHFRGFKGEDCHRFLEIIRETNPGNYELIFGS